VKLLTTKFLRRIIIVTDISVTITEHQLIMDNTLHYKHHDFIRPRPGRPFQRGDFKYIILQFLKEQPSYGYEIMRGLQERFHRFYVPSPGSIYPTLQMLEEMGHVTSAEEEGKRIYTITEAGLEFLSDHKECVKRTKDQMRNWCNPENIDDISKTMHEFENLAGMVRENVRKANAGELNRIRKILFRASKDISKK
jgi:DNA-binding PadR family transcriptional regulator